jgi:hypothetical protein
MVSSWAACFRGGCLTGPDHSGAELHGFLSYLMKCAVSGRPYKVLGYKGKQVRDNIHSFDLVNAFWHFFKNPRMGEVYNIGGGRYANCSMLEAMALCEELTGRVLNWSLIDDNRTSGGSAIFAGSGRIIPSGRSPTIYALLLWKFTTRCAPVSEHQRDKQVLQPTFNARRGESSLEQHI